MTVSMAMTVIVTMCTMFRAVMTMRTFMTPASVFMYFCHKLRGAAWRAAGQ